MELKSLLINKCIALYEDMLSDHENDNSGKPPQILIIEYKNAIRRTAHHYKLIPQEKWSYSEKKLNEINIAAPEEENTRSGMYYQIAHALFYWDLEKDKAFLNISFGPRYGRGYSFDIETHGNDYELTNEDIEWVS